MKLTNILEQVISEVGEATAKPYYYEIAIDDEDNRVYNFETDSNTYYEVDLKEIEPENPLSADEGIRLNINFGITDEEGTKDMKTLSNKGELYRVMATVVAAVKEDLANHKYIKTLEFEPSKRVGKDDASNARETLYKRYVQKAFPQSTTSTQQDGKVIVKLK